MVPKAERLDLHFLFHALAGQDLPAIVADSAVPGLNRNLAYEMNIQLVPDEKVADNFRNFARTIFVRRDQLWTNEARQPCTRTHARAPHQRTLRLRGRTRVPSDNNAAGSLRHLVISRKCSEQGTRRWHPSSAPGAPKV